MAALLSLGLAACVTGPIARNPAEQDYLTKIALEPIEFELPKDQADDAMGRAQVFLAKYSSMKIQTATTNVVETYNPQAGTAIGPQQYGYQVTRANIGDKAHILIRCSNGLEGVVWKSAHELPERNARILARYMRTGTVEFPDLIAR